MGYFERLWSELPDALPEGFQARRDFLLGALEAPARVLDAGCGAGHFAAALERAGFAVTGVDVAAEALRRARERCPAARFELVRDGEPWPLAERSFDAAWVGETLEHVQDGIGLLEQVARALAPGGLLVATTPAHGPALRLALGLSRAAFERHFDPRSDHVRFFTASTLRELLERSGFASVSIRARGGTLYVTARAAR